MPVIKLDATTSTNDFLKDLAQASNLQNFTVVTAEHQTSGRGQRTATWHSERGKNLTFSILVKDSVSIDEIFTLNVAIALSVINALKSVALPQLAIKWPNDIMAVNKKIGGILIENILKPDGAVQSIVGIGINVNQTNFENLPKASSIAAILQREFDRDLVLNLIVTEITNVVSNLADQKVELWKKYESNLYKKGVPMPFESNDGHRFMGIIQKVTQNGRLEIIDQHDQIKTFDIKEIQILY